jgi:uncharacterized protein
MHIAEWDLAVAFAAAFLAGFINSVAGGGTLLSFPTLVYLGLPSVIANATSTVAIWPGSLGSIWGFRRELGCTEGRMRLLIIPGTVGGFVGAALLRLTPTTVFDRLVPFLILFATALFLVQEPIKRRLRVGQTAGHRAGLWIAGAAAAQLLVGLYGGYFGAGISILMLSLLGLLGMSDILEMNALTSLFSLCINGVASLLFIAAKIVYWPYVLVMAAGSIMGGYGAAGVARKVGRTAVRRFVICVGLTMGVVLLIRAVR